MAEWSSLGLDFVTLRVFKAAVEEKSFANAAEREHIAASAISRRISEFENRIGITLLERHDRGVKPTAAGKVLMRHVESLFDIVQGTMSDLQSMTQGQTGEVRILANLATISSTLPETLGNIQKEHSGISLKLEQCNSEASLQRIRHGGADIAIVSGCDNFQGLTAFEYATEPLVLAVPPDHILCEKRDGLTIKDLKNVNYIGLRSNLQLHDLIVRKAIGYGFELQTTIIVDGFDSVGKYVAAGLGVAVMPECHAIEATQARGTVMIRLLDDWAIRKTHICAKSVSSLAPSVRIVLNAMLDEKSLSKIEQGYNI